MHSTQPYTMSSLPPTSTQSSSNNAAASLAAQFASNQIISTRRDFMSYALSLMRTYTNEHRDQIPSVDISLLKHVAYAFDGMMFYLRTRLPTNFLAHSLKEEDECEEDSEMGSDASSDQSDDEAPSSDEENSNEEEETATHGDPTSDLDATDDEDDMQDVIMISSTDESDSKAGKKKRNSGNWKYTAN